MEGFITFLLFFALFMWVMKRLFPLLMAWFIKRQVKKGRGTFFTNFGGPGGFGYQHNEQKKEEGKVIISDVPKQEKVIDKEVGEYVDFEE